MWKRKLLLIQLHIEGQPGCILQTGYRWHLSLAVVILHRWGWLEHVLLLEAASASQTTVPRHAARRGQGQPTSVTMEPIVLIRREPRRVTLVELGRGHALLLRVVIVQRLVARQATWAAII